MLINDGSTPTLNLVGKKKNIPNEPYIIRTNDNLNPTRMESHIFVINLLQKDLNEGVGGIL